MVTTKMSAAFFVFIFAVFCQENSEAAPYYGNIASGKLRPISGVVPMSVPRNVANKILRELRVRFDKNRVSELDSSIRNDIMQDALAPPECIDRYGLRDGIVKHIVRGTRDVIGAIIADIKGLGQGVIKDIPLVPNVINGIAEAVTLVLCGVEDAVSDAVSGIDDGPNILTQFLVQLIEFEDSAPLTNVPAAIMNITQVAGRVGEKIIEDIAHGVQTGVADLAIEVTSGVRDVVNDVEAVVSGVEEDVANVVNAAGTAVQMIGGGVRGGVDSIVQGLKGGLGGLVAAL